MKGVCKVLEPKQAIRNCRCRHAQGTAAAQTTPSGGRGAVVIHLHDTVQEEPLCECQVKASEPVPARPAKVTRPGATETAFAGIP